MKKLPIILVLFALVFIVGCLVARAGQEPAFVLSGSFNDVFAGKHDIGGSFTVSAFESNALVDMTFENGFRQVVGTDGHDSFDYYANGQAVISYGRFPSDAHEFQQVLWLVCVHDPELITNLHTYRFPFYAAYNTNDIVLQVITNSAPPNLVTSIKWYVPNYFLRGTNHYKFAQYPNGWLLAEISVTKIKVIDNAIIPSKVTFTQYTMAPVDLGKIRPDGSGRIANLPIRSPNDIVPVEFAMFSITNFQVTSPLSSYLPEILDKTARVNDKRIVEMGVVKVVSSGKWWTARELYKSREANDNE
jgi:hypothetical protein